MAERRMFARSVVESDLFTEMPLSAQALYFHLGMMADDDGFVSNPKGVRRSVGATEDDFKLLLAKRFIVGFQTGVIVIRHWKVSNYIQKDRYKETMCVEEKACLALLPDNSYSDISETGAMPCIHSVSILDTQDKLVEVIDSKGIIKEKEDAGVSTPAPPSRSSPQKENPMAVLKKFAGDNESLLAALMDFLTMRKSIKKPITTNRAATMLVNKLQSLSQNPQMQIAILNQSIFNNWQGVFELKDGAEKGEKANGERQGSTGKKWDIKADLD